MARSGTGLGLAVALGNGETILVVDDVKEQRDLATVMLNKLNYKVMSAAGGEAAVEHLKQHAVDLIVLDMIMDPVMDGLAWPLMPRSSRRILTRRRSL